jgi:hypothetical protein
MTYCQLYSSLGEVGFPQLLESSSAITNTKRIFYLLFLILEPMSVPYSWSLFLIAAIVSVFTKLVDPKDKKNGGSVLTTLTEEEAVNIFLMVFMIPSGWILRSLIKVSLAIWSLIHVCVLAEQTLLDNPDTIGLASLHPVIEWVNLSKVELAIMKNKIEIFIGLICLPAVLTGHAAMIFPVMYF